MRGHAKAVARIAAIPPGDCAVSVVTVYELFTGVAKVLRLLSAVRVLSFDEAAASRAAQVRADLEKAGNVCGPYDLLLAGHALTLGLSMATNNVGEFSRVSGLLVENWLA